MAKQAASNFYPAFLLLPREQRRAMYALYAYLRTTDDLGDADLPLEIRKALVARWRAQFHQALAGGATDPLFPALIDTVQRYAIRVEYLTDVIDGVEMDLEGIRYRTFEQLRGYCYRVASVVGLSCIHIWGFRSEKAISPAVSCGLAFQLTNILRDLKEDAARGRVYLPEEDLRHCGYSRQDLLAGVADCRLSAIIELEVRRAERFYAVAAELHEELLPPGQRVFRAMFAIYRYLLDDLARRKAAAFHSPLRLSKGEKMRLVGSALIRPQAALRSHAGRRL